MNKSILKTQPTNSLNTNLYFDAATNLGLKYEIINENLTLGRIFNEKKELFVKGPILSVNNSVGGNITRNKRETSEILKQNNVRIPLFKSFTKTKEAITYANKANFPIVVKPVAQSVAKGVTVKPTTQEEKTAAIKEAFSLNDEILIEEFIDGRNYRITVFMDKIIAISERVPAFVIGNNKNTIEELICEKNTYRKSVGLPPIKMEPKDINYLRSQNLYLSSIPNKNEFVRLKLGCNIGIGGETKRIDIKDVPDTNLNMFKIAAKKCLLNFCGVDFITPDITKPYNEVGGAINELNSAPMQEVHYFDKRPYENYSSIEILKSYFELE